MDMMKNGIACWRLPSRIRACSTRRRFPLLPGNDGRGADKVTDLIFRARVVGATQQRSAYKEPRRSTTIQPATASRKTSRQMLPRRAPFGRDAGSGRPNAGRTAVKVKTIVREAPKVAGTICVRVEAARSIRNVMGRPSRDGRPAPSLKA